MKRIFLTALVAAWAGVIGLMAQQPAKKGDAAAPKQTGPMAKSKGELTAVQALFTAAQAQNNDGVISAADELLTKFADTQFKELALTLEAGAYENKGDWAKQQTFLEQVLAVNPKNPDAHIKIADIIVKHVRENDLDKEDKLARADKHIVDGLEGLKTVEKPNAAIPDAAWEQNKTYMKAQAEDIQGLIALDRKKFDDAVTFFKAAIADAPEPAYQAQLASAYSQGGKYDEALAQCDKVLADPQLHPSIKQYVQNIKTAATKAKGAAGK